jgi:hypothetical protein
VPFICPVFEKDKDGNPTGVVVNEGRVTCWDGGVLAKESHGHGAHGFALMLISTDSRVHLVHSIGRNTDNHGRAGTRLVRDGLDPLIGARLRAHPKTGVMNADSAFADAVADGLTFRQAVRNAGLIENSHAVSHARRRESEENAAKKSATLYPLEGAPGWYANGHREVTCACGQANVAKVFRPLRDGRVSARVEATCLNAKCPAYKAGVKAGKNCGSICVTSGQWVMKKDNVSFELYDPTDAECPAPDLQLGNGLTFNDPLAEIFGTKRWAHNEGFHGVLATYYKLVWGKRYFQTLDQVRIEAAMVFIDLHLRGIESRRRSLQVAAAA